jgi:hypothetical protein
MFTAPHPAIKTLCAGGLYLALLLFPSAGWSAKILYYYNGSNYVGSCLIQGANFLREAGYQVTTIDVEGQPYDPTHDSWRDYDQVWDARMSIQDDGHRQKKCGSGLEDSPDISPVIGEKSRWLT